MTLLTGKTLISGGCPAFFVTSNLQASGKTTLVDDLHMAVTGDAMPVVTFSRSNEEFRKVLFSLAIENPTAVSFDYVDNGQRVSNSDLEILLTRDEVSGRVMDTQSTVRAPTSMEITIRLMRPPI